MVLDSGILMFSITMPYASLMRDVENFAVLIGLMIAAIILAFFTVMLVLKFQKRLNEQHQPIDQIEQTTDGDLDFDPNFQRSWRAGQKEYLANTVRTDFNPKTWLSKFSEVSIKHLLIMSLFYAGVGLVLAEAGTYIIVFFDPTYEAPKVPFHLLDAVSAGPIEETLAFGIPFYASGSQIAVLITGSLWALAHILNTDDFVTPSLAYGNLLFAIPHIFLGLRTWISGKGWFSIIFHSGWNGVIFSIACGVGEIPCSTIQGENQMSLSAILISPMATIVVSEVLLLITYLLYYRRRRKEISRLAGLPTASSQSVFSASSYRGALSFVPVASRRPSRAWYLLPVGLAAVEGILGIVAGVILYFKFRKQDSRMARNALLLGILAFAVRLGISLAT